MKFIKKFESFISEGSFAAEPEVKPNAPSVRPDVSPDRREKPAYPNPIRRDRKSPVPAPAKAGAEPEIRPETPTVKPGVSPDRREKPAYPNPIRRERKSPVPAPAKAELPTASEEDVVNRFMDLMNKSGEDIKKYIE